MKYSLLIIFSILSISLCSQNHSFGVKGVMSVTKAHSQLFSNIALVSPGFGITYDYQFKPKFSLSAEAVYVGRGFRTEVVFTNAVDQITRQAYVDERIKYISLPLKFGYSFNTNNNTYVKIGVSPSYLTKESIVFNGSSEQINNTFLNDLDMNKFDVTGLLEFGTNIKTYESSALYASVGLLCSITEVNSVDAPGKGFRNYGGELAIGYRVSK